MRTPWYAMELFPASVAPAGHRFDDTVALPVDTPRRLENVVLATELRLRALPDPHDLGRRAATHRARLEQVRADAVAAQARLVAGTYGTCLDCGGAVSLAALTQRPWTRTCVDCALDI